MEKLSLDRCKLLTLEEMRIRSDLVKSFKISKGLSAIPWNLFFRVDNSERTNMLIKEADKGKFQVGRQKVQFSQRVVNTWIGLSGEMVSAGTVDTFEKRLEN